MRAYFFFFTFFNEVCFSCKEFFSKYLILTLDYYFGSLESNKSWLSILSAASARRHTAASTKQSKSVTALLASLSLEVLRIRMAL